MRHIMVDKQNEEPSCCRTICQQWNSIMSCQRHLSRVGHSYHFSSQFDAPHTKRELLTSSTTLWWREQRWRRVSCAHCHLDCTEGYLGRRGVVFFLLHSGSNCHLISCWEETSDNQWNWRFLLCKCNYFEFKIKNNNIFFILSVYVVYLLCHQDKYILVMDFFFQYVTCICRFVNISDWSLLCFKQFKYGSKGLVTR